MAKLKVSDLPKEEQTALVQEAKELGIGGLITNYGVDTLKEKIKKVKAQKNAETDGEQKQENTDKPNKEVEQDQAEQEPDKVEEEKEKEEKTKPVDEAKVKANVKYKICHICRSKVIDGVCTGCGFTLNP